MFMARTQQDYGTLQCWAQNSVGKMEKPCLFHIVPAGKKPNETHLFFGFFHI